MKKIILFICIVMILMSTCVFATDYDPNYIIRQGYQNTEFLDAIEKPNGNFNLILRDLSSLLAAVGIGVGTCVGIIYALMWITATPAKKADLKERVFPLFAGVFLLFAGPGLAATIISALAFMLQ